MSAKTSANHPFASAALEFLSDAVERGLGDSDWTDLVIAAEARGNVELSIAPPATKDGE